MTANSVVRARIDEQTKNEAAAVLKAMGLTVSDAFRLMMVRIAKEKALPFEPLVPNEETIEAMKAALSPLFTPAGVIAIASFQRGPPGRMRGFDDHAQELAAGKWGKGPFRPREVREPDRFRHRSHDCRGCGVGAADRNIGAAVGSAGHPAKARVDAGTARQEAPHHRGDLAELGARAGPDQSRPAGVVVGSRQAPRAGAARPRRTSAKGGLTAPVSPRLAENRRVRGRMTRPRVIPAP